MSTIVAVRKGPCTAVAWDTMTTVAGTRFPNAVPRPKVRHVGANVIGVAGFAVYYNILEEYSKNTAVPDLCDEGSVFRFFLKFWRDLHEQYHLVEDQSDRESPSPFADLGAEFLVANHSGIYRVKEILSVSRFDEFCAIGSGAPHAEGALSALHGLDDSAPRIAKRAVEIAALFDTATSAPAEVLELGASLNG